MLQWQCSCRHLSKEDIHKVDVTEHVPVAEPGWEGTTGECLSRATSWCQPDHAAFGGSYFFHVAGAGEDDPAADDSADQDAGDTPHASAKAEDSSGSFKGKGKGAKGKGAKGKGAKGPGKGPKGRGDKAGRTKRGRDAANLNKLKNDFPGLNIMDFENMDMDALKTQLDEMQAARDQGAALPWFCMAVVICSLSLIGRASRPARAQIVNAAP